MNFFIVLSVEMSDKNHVSRICIKNTCLLSLTCTQKNCIHTEKVYLLQGKKLGEKDSCVSS